VSARHRLARVPARPHISPVLPTQRAAREAAKGLEGSFRAPPPASSSFARGDSPVALALLALRGADAVRCQGVNRLERGRRTSSRRRPCKSSPSPCSAPVMSHTTRPMDRDGRRCSRQSSCPPSRAARSLNGTLGRQPSRLTWHLQPDRPSSQCLVGRGSSQRTDVAGAATGVRGFVGARSSGGGFKASRQACKCT
jgi:hypothetical protein